ncbi:MAG: peptide-methionine (S)-S-oxide reductase MsrA, partial [Chitinophagaceae bacterium]|nr:peptide-methionine (S)-S-oxide reductase MsrA [Chitinophagaceae bacterium]
MNQSGNPENGTDTLVLGGGCFWCVEAQYQLLEGVLSIKSGYAGGKIPNPTYKEVCTGMTGHAEVIEVVYDRSKISTDEILAAFWQAHDPTQLNRQGNDVGTQYRSVIFYTSDEQ